MKNNINASSNSLLAFAFALEIYIKYDIIYYSK